MKFHEFVARTPVQTVDYYSFDMILRDNLAIAKAESPTGRADYRVVSKTKDPATGK
jgi:hypothetical protein